MVCKSIWIRYFGFFFPLFVLSHVSAFIALFMRLISVNVFFVCGFNCEAYFDRGVILFKSSICFCWCPTVVTLSVKISYHFRLFFMYVYRYMYCVCFFCVYIRIYARISMYVYTCVHIFSGSLCLPFPVFLSELNEFGDILEPNDVYILVHVYICVFVNVCEVWFFLLTCVFVCVCVCVCARACVCVCVHAKLTSVWCRF